MATTTQAQYNASVAKFGKAKTDEMMAKQGITLESTNPTPAKVIEVVVPQPKPIAGTPKVAEPELPVINVDEKQIEAERRIAAQKRKEYMDIVTKGRGSQSVLKNTEIKYGVNSPEYKNIKSKIDFYETPLSNVRAVDIKKEVKPINNQTFLSTAQYNTLLKKYGDVEGVIAATKQQYGANSPEVKKIENLLNNYSGVSTNKNVRTTNVITDSKLRASDDLITGVKETKNKPVVVDNNTTKENPENAISDGTLEKKIDLKTDLMGEKKTDLTGEKKTDLTGEKKTDLTGEKKTDLTGKQNIEISKVLNKLRLAGQSDEASLKKVEDKFGKNSDQYKKLSQAIENNPLTDSTLNVDETLLKKTKEQLDEAQIKSLEAAKDENIAITAENFIKGAEVISANNEKLQDFYKNMAEELKVFIEDNKVRKEKALQRTRDSELNRVVGQIRATLARRGVDVGNIAPEQLIAMSGELGVEAMRKINDATTEMENSVTKLTSDKTAEINKLLENGLIKQSEADASIEQMRQLKEKMISDIKSNFVTNTFNITKASIADADKNKADALNTISTFTTQLGISGTAQGIMENYLNAGDSVEALTNMIKDLNDKNSKLYQAVADAQKAAQLAAQFEAKIKLMNATKSASSGSSTTTSPKYTATQISALDNIGRVNGVPELSNVRTVDQYLSILKTLPETKATNIRNDFDKYREGSGE